MPKISRTATLVAVVAAVLVATASAQDQPSFYLEGIRTAGLERTSEEIVLSELLLRPNRSYTEAELEQARRRILRLPSILDAELSLERGSLDGRYILVVAVKEAKPFFFGLLPNVYSGRLDDIDLLTAGARAFVGRNGIAHIAAGTGDDSGAEVGYTHHGLFGGRGVVSAAIGTLIDDYPGDEPSLRLFASVAIDSMQSIQFGLSSKAWERTYSRQVFGPDPEEFPTIERRLYDVNARTALIRWVHDTTDDPFLPLAGTSLSLGAELEIGDSVMHFLNPDGPGVVFPEVDRRTLAAVGSFRRNWQMRTLDTLWLSGFGRIGRHSWDGVDEFDTSAFEDHLTGVAWLGYSGSFWSAGRTQERGDFRWEVALGARYDENNIQDGVLSPLSMRTGGPVLTEGFEKGESLIFVGVVRRTSWGVFRLGVGWGEDL